MRSLKTQRVVVAEPLAGEGLSILREAGLQVCEAHASSSEQLQALVAGAQALIVRSKTKVTAELLHDAASLQVVARAGVGVDAIDVEAATKAGIVVLYTPDASTLATAEHTLAMILALCRHLGAARDRLKAQRWDARELSGTELSGKTLGIVGLGRIGSAVAVRARAFGMLVVAHDVLAGEARAESLGVALVSFEELLKQADIVSLHTPLTAQTTKAVDAAALAMMKPGARLVNCARGGLVDESALLAALESGRLWGAALDVLSDEPPASASAWALVNHPRVVATPHLGGSTLEAQERIAADLCRDVVAVLQGQAPSNAVNAPVAPVPEYRPYVDLAHRLGAAFPQVCSEKDLSRFDLLFEGEWPGDSTPFVVAFLIGVLPQLTDQRVSAVNAQQVASRLGVSVEVLRAPCERGFSKALAVLAHRSGLAGVVVHRDQPRIIEVDGFEVDIAPSGPLVLTRHHDVPGIVGKVGTILGSTNINISTMQVARNQRGEAMLIAAIDRPVDAALLARLREIEDVRAVAPVQL